MSARSKIERGATISLNGKLEQTGLRAIYIRVYFFPRFVTAFPFTPLDFYRGGAPSRSSLALNLAAGSPRGDVLRARNQLPRLSPRGRAASGVSGSPT